MRTKNCIQPITSDNNASDSVPLSPSRSAVYGENAIVITSEARTAPNGISNAQQAESIKQNERNARVAPEVIFSPQNLLEDQETVPQDKSVVYSMTICEIVESPEEKKLRKQSHIIIFITCFIMSIGFSIVLTSIWPYLQQLDSSSSKVFYGFVVAINPLGQLLAAPLLGWWGNKAGCNRWPFLVSIAFYIFGNLLYALLRLMPSSSVAYVLMLSRFLVGVGSANMAVCRSYLSASTTLADRNHAIGYSSAAQSLGLILGPAIQTALAVAIPERSYSASHNAHNTTVEAVPIGYLIWDLYTAAGWIAVILGLMNAFLFVPWLYKEVNISHREAQLKKRQNRNTNEKYPPPDYFTLLLVLCNFFLILFVYVLLETILVPMGKDLYGWSSEFAIKTVGILLSIIGIVAFFVFFLCGQICKKVDERKVYICLGLVPLIIAMIIHIPMGNNYPMMQNCSVDASGENLTHTPEFSSLLFAPGLSNASDSATLRSERSVTGLDEKMSLTEAGFYVLLNRFKRAVVPDSVGDCDALGCPLSQQWCLTTPIVEIPQIIVGNVFGVIGYPIAFTLSSSLFSKMISPKNQGFSMGVLTSTGSLSRMTGPIFVTWIYSRYGTRWTFGVLSVAMTVTLITAALAYNRLVPMDVNKNKSAARNSLIEE